MHGTPSAQPFSPWLILFLAAQKLLEVTSLSTFIVDILAMLACCISSARHNPIWCGGTIALTLIAQKGSGHTAWPNASHIDLFSIFGHAKHYGSSLAWHTFCKVQPHTMWWGQKLLSLIYFYFGPTHFQNQQTHSCQLLIFSHASWLSMHSARYNPYNVVGCNTSHLDLCKNSDTTWHNPSQPWTIFFVHAKSCQKWPWFAHLPQGATP